MRFKTLLAICALTGAAVMPASAITFSTFVSQGDLMAALDNSATIGFSYAGDKFVGSVYFGPNNNQLYATDLNGGGVRAFGPPIPGAVGEVYVSSSLGLGGFGRYDVFAGSQSGTDIYRLAHDGSSVSLFASGLGGGAVRSMAFDPYGRYGYDMIVGTQLGDVYRVNSSGVASLLARVYEDTEGMSFAPQSFGPYAAGTLFTMSEGSGSLRAIPPDGVVSSAVVHIAGAEMLSFVPLNLGASGDPVEGFYEAAYPLNVQKAPAAEFAPYIGDAIITSETGGGVFQVRWNVTNAAFETHFLTALVSQPEDGIFVTADIIKPAVPEPSGWVMMLSGALWVVWVFRSKRGPP